MTATAAATAKAAGRYLRLHGRLARSRANGPGLRSVIWFQGCTLACRDCFNPESHVPTAGRDIEVAGLVDEILRDTAAIEGVTISGGEPLQQPEALLALLTGLRGGSGLSTLVFSGYRLEEIGRGPVGRACLDQIDLLVAGRYVPARHQGHGLLGSSNQEIHFLSDRYVPSDLENLPQAEVQVDPAGRVRVTGVGAPGDVLPSQAKEPAARPW